MEDVYSRLRVGTIQAGKDKVSLELSQTLHIQVRAAAFARNKTVVEFIEEAIADALRQTGVVR